MTDATDQEPKKRSAKPLTEVGAMARIDDLLAPFPTDAAQRIVLYFASRVGFDIRPLLLNGNGERSES